MRFENTGFLLLALAVPLAGLWWTFLRARREKRLRALTLRVPKASASGLQMACIVIGLLLAILAAARPRWGKSMEKMSVRARNIVIAIDVSQSMLARDVRPNRIERTKADVADLIDSMEGDRCALVAFRNSGKVLCPLTTDRAFLRNSLEGVSIDSAPRGMTDIGGAIRTALSVLDPAADDHNAIIIISDGGDLRGEALKNAALAKSRGIPIFTVGVGDTMKASPIPLPDGSGYLKHNGDVVRVKLEEDALKQVAKVSDGSYVHIMKAGMAETSLGSIYRRFIRKVMVMDQREEESRLGERYQYFLVPGLVLLLIGASLSNGRFAKKGEVGKS